MMLDRRQWMMAAGAATLTTAAPVLTGARKSGSVSLFLCGDVMTGRGIDQVLPHPSDPRIYESYLKSAVDYVALAERVNGPIHKPVSYDYVWGEAIAELDRRRPDARIINLETSITKADQPEPKGINYRMNPENVPCIEAAHIDCCVLANNHVLDWGRDGCVDTLSALHHAGIQTAGAGNEAGEAARAAVLLTGHGRIFLFGVASETSGVPPSWAATATRPGVDLLPDLSTDTADRLAERVHAVREDGDLVVVSIHWGGNWGYQIPSDQRGFAHRLIDRDAADVVHGHSSHHAKGIEIYEGKPIFYGCGDFINDYEGIGGYEPYRGDLALMYFPTLDVTKRNLIRLEIVPLQMKRLRLHRPSNEDARWVCEVLARESKHLGTTVTLADDGTLRVGSA
ncbi:MAG: CapA family protein [Myxococcales bacterium]|jgi:poly-gamma-glutamate synthesis protein (capsule biosynthesis protein)